MICLNPKKGKRRDVPRGGPIENCSQGKSGYTSRGSAPSSASTRHLDWGHAAWCHSTPTTPAVGGKAWKHVLQLIKDASESPYNTLLKDILSRIFVNPTTEKILKNRPKGLPGCSTGVEVEGIEFSAIPVEAAARADEFQRHGGALGLTSYPSYGLKAEDAQPHIFCSPTFSPGCPWPAEIIRRVQRCRAIPQGARSTEERAVPFFMRGLAENLEQWDLVADSRRRFACLLWGRLRGGRGAGGGWASAVPKGLRG